MLLKLGAKAEVAFSDSINGCGSCPLNPEFKKSRLLFLLEIVPGRKKLEGNTS
jgi:hypothetical protein